MSYLQAFSHVLLLGKGGKQVYCGRREFIRPYLETLGFVVPEHENPADWMIDVVCGLAPRYKEDGSVDEAYRAPEDLFDAWDRDHKVRRDFTLEFSLSASLIRIRSGQD